MGKWEIVRLGDVCIIERGGSPRPIEKFITSDEDGINWIKIGDTTDSMYISRTKEKIAPDGAKKSRFVKAGDFLLSNSMSFGRPYILKIDGCIHDGWLLIRDEKNRFNKRFLYYYLGSDKTYSEFKGLAVGGVVNNLNSSMVRNFKIPLPPLEVQRQIADVLDRASALIEKRKAQIDKLDLLVKSRFIEMFGDPVANPMGWEIKLLGDIFSIIDGDRGTQYPKGADFFGSGYCAFLNTGNVTVNGFDFSNIQYITEEKDKQLRKGRFEQQDIVLTTRGTVGNIALFTNNVPYKVMRINSGMVLLRHYSEVIHSDYFISLVRSFPIIKKYLSGSAQPQLPIINMKKIPIPVPPLLLQNAFAVFVRQADKSKFEMQKSLAKLEQNYKSLMQKCFRGEIF